MENGMIYMKAGIVGLLIGIWDLALMWLSQKKEGILFFEKEHSRIQKTFLLVLAGMVGIGVWLIWLLEKWDNTIRVELLLCGYLLPLAISDYRYRLLPDTFHIGYGVIFLIYKLLFADFYGWINGGIAAILILAILGFVHLIKKEQFGLGDLKVLSTCAFLVGMPGILYLFFRGLVAAALFSLIQLIRKRIDLKTEFPFIPFLLIGVLI